MLTNALIKSSALAGRFLFATQRRNAVSTPPLRRMPFPQKLLIGGSMIFASFCLIPGYILVNLKYYNKSAYETKEIDEDDED